MARRSKSSAGWLREHFTDPFVKRAHAEGWRSRAVFKLEEIDRKDRLIAPGMVVLDLGAAPGAWSQYARRKVGRKGRVVASDILEMEPLEGVEFLQGDFRDEEVFARLLATIPARGVDLVLSDIAPNMSGTDAIDQPRSMYLCELALDMAAQVLKPGGSALIKTFQGSGFPELVASARGHFGKVKFAKPAASRARSPELYLLARDYRMV
ncbi:MAG: 23S rRNA (uridine(2552)-2'-O)-methyltransferase RlmE [Steroidobacteraceae bacterium]